jgi:hypothetical protein
MRSREWIGLKKAGGYHRLDGITWLKVPVVRSMSPELIHFHTQTTKTMAYPTKEPTPNRREDPQPEEENNTRPGEDDNDGRNGRSDDGGWNNSDLRLLI